MSVLLVRKKKEETNKSLIKRRGERCKSEEHFRCNWISSLLRKVMGDLSVVGDKPLFILICHDTDVNEK